MDGITKSKIFTISPSQSFVDVLASGIVKRVGSEPCALTSVQVLLPTRHACRSLREAFLRLSGGNPVLLPLMGSLGDIDEDEFNSNSSSLLPFEREFSSNFTLDVAPAISPVRRQLLLGRLIMARGNIEVDQAIQLARELARLIDQMHTERCSLDNLSNLVPSEYAAYWQTVLDFLKIITVQWPGVLKEEGALDPADRRNRLLDALASRWKMKPPRTPIYAAGSTGSIPATADLLAVIARLPKGAVILPGVDCCLSESSWKKLEPHHPQYGLAYLLQYLGVLRKNIRDWSLESKATKRTSREKLINSSFNPASSNLEGQFGGKIDLDFLNNFQRIDCPTPREEAGVIALAMREVLETSKKTAALITPDRKLARRVAAELKRWDIEVYDSAGGVLSGSSAGTFLRLIIGMVAEKFSPVSLLAALKHPLACGGMKKAIFSRLVRKLEILILRGPRLRVGLGGLCNELEKQTDQHLELRPLLALFKNLFGPIVSEFEKGLSPVGNLINLHLKLAEALSAKSNKLLSEELWLGIEGEALRTFFLKLIEGVSVLDPINPALYPSIIDALMSGVNVKPKPRAYPRLHIWGLMEGRLQHADLMILGGLNEGVWPPEVNSNPWMSRPMMQKFGLSLPERRIGLTAHDFSQACAAKNVLLTRSTRINGSPMVPSRWLQKIENCLTTIENGYSFPTNYQYLNWFLQIDSPSSICPRPPPCPRPPLESRPKTLSVTSVETWIRDPYSIFAEKILLLKPLEPLDADPGATDKGLLIHKCLEIFIKRYPSGMLSEDAFQNLISIGNQVFDEVIAHPGIRAFWWPRFERIARWFVDFENNRRINNISPIAIEAKGSLNLFVDGVAFNLTARIDRIDCCPGGGIIIVDYKTGGLPSSKQVESGLSPQLLLEALIAGEGGVKGIVSKKVEKLEYIRLSGGLVPGEVRPLIFNLEKVASETLEGLHRLISKFNCLETPYLSRPRPQFKSRFGRYDHLARVKEWSHGSLGEDL